MEQIPNGVRNVLRREQQPGTHPSVGRPADHEARLAAHEKRIHDHPCPCGSGLRYADCCIRRPDQEERELYQRRQLAQRGMTSCEACGREFPLNHDLTCPYCGFDNGPGELPRTEASMRRIERRRDREMRRFRREET